MAEHIAVIGSPGSGKSVFAAALAKETARHKKRAVIVSGDSVIPMLPFFCGFTDTKGLGVLCGKQITPASVADAIRILPDDANIGVIARQVGEETGDITGGQIRDMAAVLDQLADVVIWDGISDIKHVFDRTILQLSNLQVCILTPDIKGSLYFEEHYKTLWDYKALRLLEGLGRPYSPSEEMHITVGGFYGTLPYSRGIERVCLEGEVFAVNKACHEKYSDIVKKIIEEVLADKEA